MQRRQAGIILKCISKPNFDPYKRAIFYGFRLGHPLYLFCLLPLDPKSFAITLSAQSQYHFEILNDKPTSILVKKELKNIITLKFNSGKRKCLRIIVNGDKTNNIKKTKPKMKPVRVWLRKGENMGFIKTSIEIVCIRRGHLRQIRASD